MKKDIVSRLLLMLFSISIGCYDCNSKRDNRPINIKYFPEWQNAKLPDPTINFGQIFFYNKVSCDSIKIRPALEDADNFLCACKIKTQWTIYEVNVPSNKVVPINDKSVKSPDDLSIQH